MNTIQPHGINKEQGRLERKMFMSVCVGIWPLDTFVLSLKGGLGAARIP